MKLINKYLNIIYISIILIFSILVVLPYLYAGYFPTHDGLWAVVRTSEMFREIKDHQFPPRMSEFLNYNYGYPLFNFAYPFPYYVTFIFHLFKLSFINSTKLLFALTVPISAIFMYLSVKEIFKNKTAALVSSLIYIFYPYRLVDLYVRGSIGESMGFMLFPILFYLAIKIRYSINSRIYAVLFGLTFAALITSHNIMTVLFTPIIFIICFLLYKKDFDRKILINYLLGFILGIGLAFYFLGPALVEEHLIRLSVIPIADRNLYYSTVSQLVIPAWGYGIPGAKDSFSYQIGFPQLIIFLISIILTTLGFLKKKFHQNIGSVLTHFALLYSIFIILLQFKFSSFFWVHTPLFKEINYPWTYLAPLGFLMSLVTGYAASNKNKIIQILVGVITLVAIIYYLPFAKPSNYIYYPDSYYYTNQATTTSSSELMPLWVKNYPLSMPDQKVEIIKSNENITNLISTSKNISFNINLNSESLVRINQIYYPGWKIYVDGKMANISYGNPQGVMYITVLKGVHHINAKFSETSFRLFADIISLGSFLIGVLIIIFNLKKRDSSLRSE